MERKRRRSKVIKEEIISNDNEQKNTDLGPKSTDRHLSDVQNINNQQICSQPRCKLTSKTKIILAVTLLLIFIVLTLTITLTLVLKPRVKEIKKKQQLKFQDGSKMSLIDVVIEEKNFNKKNQEIKITHSEVQKPTQSLNQTTVPTNQYSDTIQFKQLGIIIKITPNSSTKILIHPKTFVSYMKEKHLQTMSDEQSEQQNTNGNNQWEKQLISQLTILFNKQYNKNNSEAAKIVFNKVPYVKYCLNNQTNRYQSGCLRDEKMRLLTGSDTTANKITKNSLQTAREVKQVFGIIKQSIEKQQKLNQDIRNRANSAKQFKAQVVKTAQPISQQKKATIKGQQVQQNGDPHELPIRSAKQFQNNCFPESATQLLCHAEMLGEIKKQQIQGIQAWLEGVHKIA